ncbi:conserved Plasmodium protein, unknown function [Plasmodium gallinaceum]|uniref:DUF7641 domain-containing protein n=1 Tax=Plasmodium gallinaceum TaxID=5849 RepID=A0A1J1H0J6_PLAGA|nr:conserved Plasmodium protein, unknown function [Plasmodium gallinaceum]CRG97050.1 conserved Plasmodium protein, unknown function [Plasmodium gallinaceum]
MSQFYDKLERYEPDEKTKNLCTNYIYFLLFYNSYVLILYIYTFFATSISFYGWLFFMNLYFCVFPVFSFMRNSYIPILLRFYNWMLLVSSIISIIILFEGIFLYKKLEFYLIIIYSFLTTFNSLLCWNVTQRIFEGKKTVNDILETLRSKSVTKNEYINSSVKKEEKQKKFIGKGRTIKDSNYVKV